HTKLLLFDNDDGTAEIWVGSHNWTQRALIGPNIEASVVMRVEQGSPIYDRVARMLDFIQSQCEPYRPELLEEYKKLQRQQAEGVGRVRTPVIDLQGANLLNLGDAITIFGAVSDDLGTLKT